MSTPPFSRMHSASRSFRSPGEGRAEASASRIPADWAAISASRVRALMEEGNLEAIRPLVPEITYETIRRMASLRHD